MSIFYVRSRANWLEFCFKAYITNTSLSKPFYYLHLRPIKVYEQTKIKKKNLFIKTIECSNQSGNKQRPDRAIKRRLREWVWNVKLSRAGVFHPSGKRNGIIHIKDHNFSDRYYSKKSVNCYGRIPSYPGIFSILFSLIFIIVSLWISNTTKKFSTLGSIKKERRDICNKFQFTREKW